MTPETRNFWMGTACLVGLVIALMVSWYALEWVDKWVPAAHEHTHEHPPHDHPHEHPPHDHPHDYPSHDHPHTHEVTVHPLSE